MWGLWTHYVWVLKIWTDRGFEGEKRMKWVTDNFQIWFQVILLSILSFIHATFDGYKTGTNHNHQKDVYRSKGGEHTSSTCESKGIKDISNKKERWNLIAFRCIELDQQLTNHISIHDFKWSGDHTGIESNEICSFLGGVAVSITFHSFASLSTGLLIMVIIIHIHM